MENRVAKRRERSTATAGMLERDAALDQIASTLTSVMEADGAVIPVEGPAGAGKSSLLRAAADLAAEKGFDVLRATGRELERGFAFGVVTQLFAARLAALDDAGRNAAFAGAAELARPLFEGGEELAPDGEVFPRLHGLHWLCANVSSLAPVLLVVDDAQWVDQLSLDFLAYLAPRVQELGLCLAIGIRSAETEAGSALSDALAREGIQAIEPAPLTEAAIAELLRDPLGEGAGERLAPECARATGGNPLFVQELIRDLIERDDAGVDPASIADRAPASVGRIVVDRVSSMPEQDGRVVRAIAILGEGADSQLIEELCALDADRIAASVDRLIEVGVLDDEQLLGFAHPIVRQAIHESIPPAARSQDHLQAARALSVRPGASERAAAHLLEADATIEPAGDAAVDALLAAARRAAKRGATETAIAYLERALSEELDRERRRRALLELGTAELRRGSERALEHLGEADAISDDGPQRAEAALTLAAAQMQLGALADAGASCTAALEVIGDARELRLALEAQRAHSYWAAGTLTDHERQRLHALEAEVGAGSTPAERTVLAVLAVEAGVSGKRQAAKVDDLADRALADGKLLADVGAEHPSYTAASAGKTLAYEFAAAIDGWSAGLQDSRRRGSLYGYANALFSRSYAKHMAGDIPGAQADAIEGFTLLPESGLITAPLPLATAANVAVERGELDPAIEQALERMILPEEVPSLGTVNYATLALGRLALSRGNLEQALDHFTETGRRADLIGWTGPAMMPWRSSAALALRGLERYDEALAMADSEVELALAFGAAGPLGIALRAKALVVGGEQGIELAREAVVTLAGSEARLEHAKALIDLGAGLRREGAPRDSREKLREGMDLAYRCGSTQAIERAMSELRASGTRPRRPAQRGAAALSPQEFQTTRRAAEGLSNRKIAEAMFLTRRTVEMHLSNAYRKLNISSRDELAAALEGDAAA